MRFQPVSRIAIALVASALTDASAEDTLALARKALLNEGIATAWKLSQKALAEAPESAAAHQLSAEVLFRRGDFVSAEREFSLAAKLDPKSAPPWWGLSRIAECTSMHKTAAALLDRAHSLDPTDPRIFHDWAMRLPGPQHIQALEQYASMADPTRDEKQLDDLRQHIRLDRALQGRALMVLASPYQSTEIPLLNLVNSSTRTLYYGLEVSLGGINLRLVLDTGASGILIPRWAAARAGVTELAGATFGGIGDNPKPSAGYHGIVDRVRIGTVELRDALISVSNQDSIGTTDGLIGTNVFSEFLVTLDFTGRKLRLDPLPGYRPGDSELHDRVTSPALQHFAPVYRFGHLLLVPTRVSDSREVLFVLDTGADRTLLSYDMAAEVSNISRNDRMRLQGLNGQVADLYQTGNLFLQFAGFRQRNPAMTAVDMWPQSRNLGTEVSGFLGLPVLSLFTLTLDYRDGLVHFDRQQP